MVYFKSKLAVITGFIIGVLAVAVSYFVLNEKMMIFVMIYSVTYIGYLLFFSLPKSDFFSNYVKLIMGSTSKEESDIIMEQFQKEYKIMDNIGDIMYISSMTILQLGSLVSLIVVLSNKF